MFHFINAIFVCNSFNVHLAMILRVYLESINQTRSKCHGEYVVIVSNPQSFIDTILSKRCFKNVTYRFR